MITEEEDKEIAEIITCSCYNDGIVEYDVLLYTTDKETYHIDIVQNDEPLLLAEYVTAISNTKYKLYNKYGQWARHFKRPIQLATYRKSILFNNFVPPANYNNKHKRKKAGVNN